MEIIYLQESWISAVVAVASRALILGIDKYLVDLKFLIHDFLRRRTVSAWTMHR